MQEGGSERKTGSKRSGKREATQVEHSRMKMSPGRLLINYRPLSLCFHARWDLFFLSFQLENSVAELSLRQMCH